MNDLEIFECYIINTYLNTKFHGKLWNEAGTDFVSDKGEVIIIAMSLYVLNSYCDAWRKVLAETF